jgi:hypothetical protein
MKIFIINTPLSKKKLRFNNLFLHYPKSITYLCADKLSF